MSKCKNIANKCVCKHKIADRMRLYEPLINEFINASNKRKMELMQSAPPCFVRLVCECGLNILKGNVVLPNAQYKKLRPHRRLMLLASKPSISIEKKRKFLANAKGGFLPIIIPYILSALSGLAGQAIAKAF
jgi:hypothetical protein